MAPSITVVQSELRRSLLGPAWHGPAVLEVLADVTAEEAVARPVAGAHSIVELAVHVLAWIEEVTRRLATNDARLPARGDWSSPGTLSAEDWARLVEQIESAGHDLLAALERFPEDRLDDIIGSGAPDPPTGSGVPYRATLHGLAQHNAYHGGQMAVLKKALRGGV